MEEAPKQSTYSKKFYYDLMDRKCEYTRAEHLLNSPYLEKEGFEIWHLENRDEPTLAFEKEYLDIPLPDFNEIKKNGGSYSIDDAKIPWEPPPEPNEKPLSEFKMEFMSQMYSYAAKNPKLYAFTRLRELEKNLETAIKQFKFGLEQLYKEIENASTI